MWKPVAERSYEGSPKLRPGEASSPPKRQCKRHTASLKVNSMNLLKLPLICLLLVSIVATPIAGQQKRRTTEKPPAKSPAAPAPARVPPVTFDTLIAADSFKVYGEVRSIGQLIQSSAANDVLEPIFRLGGPPTEFGKVVGWLRSHADDLMTSR